VSTKPRWNSNLHAFDALLRPVSTGAKRGLDVGCGEGETSRMLRRHTTSVVALDPHDPSIAEARSFADDIEYLVGDLESINLPKASFDVVSAVAMLHHIEHREGLRLLAELVAPGGTLLTVGLAKSQSPRDYARDAWDAVTIRRQTITNGVWETPAPKVWPPPLTYAETRTASLAVLHDADFRRVPYFRYALTWSKREIRPTPASPSG